MTNRMLLLITMVALLLSAGHAAAGMEVVPLCGSEPRTVPSGGYVLVPCTETPQFSGTVDAALVETDSDTAVYQLEGYGVVHVKCIGASYDVLLVDWQTNAADDREQDSPSMTAIFDADGFLAAPESFQGRLYVLSTLLRPEGPDGRTRPSASSSWVQIAADHWLRLDHPQWSAEGEQAFTGLVEVRRDGDDTWFLMAQQCLENLTETEAAGAPFSMENGALVLDRPVTRQVPVGTLFYAALRQTRSSGMELLLDGDAVEYVHYQSYMGSFQEMVLMAVRPGPAEVEIVYSRYGEPFETTVIPIYVY